MRTLAEQYIALIGEKNELQKVYLEKSIAQLEADEQDELESILYYFQTAGYSIENQAENYLAFIETVMDNTLFFLKHGRYRYSRLAEVEKLVYHNEVYMHQYMMGLTLSQYLWINHRKMMRWFSNHIMGEKGVEYLEIGPGYGQYLFKTMKLSEINRYSIVDISETAIKGLKAIANFLHFSLNGEIICADFLHFKAVRKYNIVVMNEVLEHVENPLLFLEKIHRITDKDSKIYISTAINAPALDHIYLFENVESVKKLVDKAGFKIIDYVTLTSNDKSIEYAVRKKQAINISLLIGHKE